MELEELKARYKMLPAWGRMAIASILGLLPAVYIYFDEGEVLQSALEQANLDEDVARIKFEKARDKKANLPKLEERLAYTEEQLGKAQKMLPETFRIEEVLQRTASIAKETNVKLNVFIPEAQTIVGLADFYYIEKPIGAEVSGRFADVAAFFDGMVHLEQSVFVRDVVLSALVSEAGGKLNESKSDHEIAKETRASLKVSGKFKIVVFRAMSESEANAHAQVNSDNKNAAPLPKPSAPSALAPSSGKPASARSGGA